MVVAGKAKVGPILGIVGGAMLLIGGIIAFVAIGTLEAYLGGLGMTWADIGLDPTLLYVNFLLTLLWGLIGLIGAILGLVGKKIGVFLMLIFGIIATVGMFIPIGSYTILITFPINMNSSLFYVDPILLLLGGILGLALKE